ncbi:MULTISPECIES: tRNA epoxyqueuosine(34) reductase QueG [unclassified Halomonas]|uniref:tRNA epoxyqueuosine(34) reductase QueG n=1 Tax=unclassified Halomonas TaxID=2609666 RepID=UPI001EF560E2|nr:MULTISPECIES: tRNA epoxyqueuosine(34) reductase QueG [unclassified Halomonas]MCG7577684.1 tRNA epoxyqueuosine(34) reductase QueG [Halomonas sp. MMH1-48]MCG7604784.1 tRNA epoxyqueuosine(34) reductase QueG [Halomonas sp. MM17-34]MCG7614001.1 tRNA epoxyqueuosine(34) reductase QueG [Halomonas sp. MM17-29]MCG7620903.1 tRNA epoxyqueuosine(34) reductase QueG [Halomonas sp. DSH1-27]
MPSSITFPPSSDALTHDHLHRLAEQIKQWGRELGFQQVGIADTDLAAHEAHLNRWLESGYHGEMAFMAKHGTKRTRPEELEPGTQRVISVRIDYLPAEVESAKVLGQPHRAYVSRYALGRDYHKLMRKRLAQLAKQIEREVGKFGFRAFVDSAPVMERALAQKAGLGWFGKNAMLLNPKAGSLFFLGELYTDLPLPVDAPFEQEHCGSCSACRTACPTGAIVDDKVVDSRKCISYLTIELPGAIPEEYRRAMGNRVYGCDDCQLVCPFTRFTKITQEADFAPRHDLDRASLIALFSWGEEEFLDKTAGSPIRRIGYERWLRNLAVGLGNAPWSDAVEAALWARRAYPSDLVREHVAWALAEQRRKRDARIATRA